MRAGCADAAASGPSPAATPTMRSATTWFAAATAVLLAAGVGHAPAGTRRHDVADAEYTSLAAQPEYASVGYISTPASRASGVLVANNYVLTAAHVGEESGTLSFKLTSGTTTRAWTVLNPGWTGDVGDGCDLALVRLSTLVLSEQPAEFYTATNEVGQTGTIVGFGRTGTGLTGDTEPAGTKRAGQNVWDKAGTFLGYTSDVLLADFDNPDNRFDSWFGLRKPIALEYCAAPGDSGGGMFLADGGTQKLAGIVSFVAYRDGDGDSDYGDAMGVARISSHLGWLTASLSASYTMDWIAASGGFNVAGNWQSTFGTQTVHAVPGALDAVRFATAGSRTVTWPAADLANTRLGVAAGSVTLNLAGRTYTLTETSPTQPSLVVGEAAGSQSLTVLGGTLATRHAFLGAATGSVAAMTVGSGAAWNAAGSVYVGGTDAGPGGSATLTLADGAQTVIGGGLTVWEGGTVNLAGGGLDLAQLALSGGTLAGRGTFNVPVLCQDGFLGVADGDTFTLAALALDADAILTKTGGGTAVLDGLTCLGTGALLDVLDGAVRLNADAGAAAAFSIAVTDAVLTFGSSQHLDTLQIGSGGKVVVGGDYTVVVRHLLLGGVDLGSTVMTPEPSALALLALGGLGLFARRRSR